MKKNTPKNQKMRTKTDSTNILVLKDKSFEESSDTSAEEIISSEDDLIDMVNIFI